MTKTQLCLLTEGYSITEDGYIMKRNYHGDYEQVGVYNFMNDIITWEEGYDRYDSKN